MKKDIQNTLVVKIESQTILIGSSEAKRPLGRYNYKQGDNIKMKLHKKLYDGIRQTELVLDRINQKYSEKKRIFFVCVTKGG